MTQEQWLIYLWSIYPDGNPTAALAILTTLSLIGLSILYTETITDYNSADPEDWRYYKLSNWHKLGKRKIIIPAILGTLLLLANLVPNREGFIYILATPYAVDAGHSIVEQLGDSSSKLYKLNQLMDRTLDKALLTLDHNTSNE